MPNFPKKGPSKKSEYYVKDRPLDKTMESKNESLRYKALENKVFYFDFKNTSTAAWLEKEIRKLGGRVEYFFGKEVQYLITDKPQTRETVPPCSPFSNPGPSPFSRPDTSQSMRDIGLTPSEWAYSEQWKKPQASSQRSRASKLMELASITKSQGSCDVLSRAKERGTTIKTVEQITSWLNTVHKKLGTKLSRDSLKETPKNPSRKLRGQYLKVEDEELKYKPQVLDDPPTWQTIDSTSLSDESPFNTEKRRMTRKQANEKAKPTSIRSILKKEVNAGKKKRNKGMIRRKGGGKCEGCNVRFENLETHLGGDQHLKYAKKDKNFDAIDLLMSEGLSLDNFMTEQQKIAAFNSKSVALRSVSSPQIKSDGSTEPLDVDGPCTRARRNKIHNDSANQSPLVPKDMELLIEAPSPRLLGGVPELENNYFLRSTPRKLVGMLDQWDLPPEQLSQASVVSDGAFLQCQSLDLCSSQGQITVQAENPASEFTVKRPKLMAPTPEDILADHVSGDHVIGPVTRSRSPSRAATRSKSPTLSATSEPRVIRSSSPSRTRPASKPSAISPSKVNSPNKRSPRLRDSILMKRRNINHS